MGSQYIQDAVDPSYYAMTQEPSNVFNTNLPGAVNFMSNEAIPHMISLQNKHRHAQSIKALQERHEMEKETLKNTAEHYKQALSLVQNANHGLNATQFSELQLLYQQVAKNPVGSLPPQIIQRQEMLTKKMDDLQARQLEQSAKVSTTTNIAQSLYDLVVKLYNQLNDAVYINQPRTFEEANKFISDLHGDVEKYINEVGTSFSPVLDTHQTPNGSF